MRCERVLVGKPNTVPHTHTQGRARVHTHSLHSHSHSQTDTHTHTHTHTHVYSHWDTHTPLPSMSICLSLTDSHAHTHARTHTHTHTPTLCFRVESVQLRMRAGRSEEGGTLVSAGQDAVVKTWDIHRSVVLGQIQGCAHMGKTTPRY